MKVYQFVRMNSGNLKFICCRKGFSRQDIESRKTDGYIIYSEEELSTVKDLFIVDNKRVVKNGKTWVNSKHAQKLINKF